MPAHRRFSVVLSGGLVLVAWLLARSSAADPLPAVLQRARQMEIEFVGGLVGGYESEIFAAFKKYIEQATKRERLLLLSHRNPVVRAYAAQYFAALLPDHAKAVAALLRDRKPVPFLETTCLGPSAFYVDAYVATELCRHVEQPEIRRILQQASTRQEVRSDVRSTLHRCSSIPPAPLELPELTEPAPLLPDTPGSSDEPPPSACARRTIGDGLTATDL